MIQDAALVRDVAFLGQRKESDATGDRERVQLTAPLCPGSKGKGWRQS